MAGMGSWRWVQPEEIVSVVKKAGFSISKVMALTRWCLPFNHNLLYGGRMSPQASKNILAKIESNQKPLHLTIVLTLINMIDQLNDLFPSKKIGVGILVIAEKQK